MFGSVDVYLLGEAGFSFSWNIEFDLAAVIFSSIQPDMGFSLNALNSSGCTLFNPLASPTHFKLFPDLSRMPVIQSNVRLYACQLPSSGRSL